MNIKLVLCLIAYVAYAKAKREYVQIPQELIAKFGETAITCLYKHGMSQEALPKLLAGEIEDSPQFRKFIFCFAMSSGYGDKNGHLDEDKMVKLVGNNKNKDKFREVTVECNKSNGDSTEDTLFNTVSCFVKKSPILFTL